MIFVHHKMYFWLLLQIFVVQGHIYFRTPSVWRNLSFSTHINVWKAWKEQQAISLHCVDCMTHLKTLVDPLWVPVLDESLCVTVSSQWILSFCVLFCYTGSISWINFTLLQEWRRILLLLTYLHVYWDVLQRCSLVHCVQLYMCLCDCLKGFLWTYWEHDCKASSQ